MRGERIILYHVAPASTTAPPEPRQIFIISTGVAAYLSREHVITQTSGPPRSGKFPKTTCATTSGTHVCLTRCPTEGGVTLSRLRGRRVVVDRY